MNALTVHIRGDNSQLQATLARTKQALAGMGTAMKTAFAVAGGATAITAAIAGITAAVAGVPKAINKAAEMQDFETSFTTLLGGADKAKKRLAELSKFAATTPFELENSVKASKVLQTLTNGALATGKGLKMVGDVAASTGEPFEELAVHFGRLYAGLKDGAPVGEAMARLQELGVLSTDTRRKLETLQKQGQKGSALWKIATADFAKFSGEMERRSKTWNGLWSNLQDNIGAAMREFGKPLLDALTPFLKDAVEYVEKLGPKSREMGETISKAISQGQQAFKDGKVGEILSLALKIAIKDAGDLFLRIFRGLGSGVASMFRGIFSGAVETLAQAARADFWGSVSNALSAAALKLQAGMIKAQVYLQTAAQWFGQSLRASPGQLKAGLGEVLGFFNKWWVRALMSPTMFLGEQLSKIAVKFGSAMFNAIRGNLSGALESAKALGTLANPAALIASLTGNFAKGLTGDAVSGNAGPTDFQSLLKKNLAGTSAGKLDADADALLSKDKAGALQEALIGIGAKMTGAVGAFGSGFKEGFNGDAFFSTGADKAELGKMLLGAQEKIAATNKRNAEVAATATGGPQKVKFKMKDGEDENGGKSSRGGVGVITSALARVGGGGLAAGGTVGVWRSMDSHLKKIVANTARQNGLQSTSVKSSGGIKTFSLSNPA